MLLLSVVLKATSSQFIPTSVISDVGPLAAATCEQKLNHSTINRCDAKSLKDCYATNDMLYTTELRG